VPHRYEASGRANAGAAFLLYLLTIALIVGVLIALVADVRRQPRGGT